MPPPATRENGDATLFVHDTLVVFDLEWTSWEDFWKHDWNLPGKYPEIVQIGAVKLDAAGGFTEIGSFQLLIRPARNPILSDYFRNLTGISQDSVDREGIPFPRALEALVDFIGSEDTDISSWGDDPAIIVRNCDLFHIPVPAIFANWIDVRPPVMSFLRMEGGPPFSSDLPALLGLPSEGRAHDALGDARSIAAALRHLRERGWL